MRPTPIGHKFITTESIWGYGSRFCPMLAAKEETTMAWTTPTLVEICIGLEINGYLPAEF